MLFIARYCFENGCYLFIKLSILDYCTRICCEFITLSACEVSIAGIMYRKKKLFTYSFWHLLKVGKVAFSIKCLF